MRLYFIIPESSTAAQLSSTTFTLLKAAHQIVTSLGTRSLALSSLAALAAETSLSHCEPAATLQHWRAEGLKHVRSGRWLKLREAERWLREKGNIKDERVQSARGAEAEQASANEPYLFPA